jgi:hypothetical protein
MKSKIAPFLLTALQLAAGRPHSSRVDVKHLEYQGIGFNQGYTSLDLFLSHPNPLYDSLYFFLDARGHVFNNGKPAVNAGVGCRYVFDSLVDALGINTYYDYRKTKRKSYNQFGVGLEYLMSNWAFRANGYFPFGAKVSELFDLEFSHFAGHSVFVSRKHEFSMTGCDGEIGWHFNRWRKADFFFGAGPYYFHGHMGNSAIGGKVRILATLGNYLSLEVGDSYDAVFHNRFHGEIALTIPFGPKPCRAPCKEQKAFQKWIFAPPYRNEIIVLDTQKKTSVALDPGNGLPYFFWFVNNTSSSNGTFESPYPTLAQAQNDSSAGDVIYVFPGDDTPTGMDLGIVLKDNQRFFGSGTAQQLPTTLGQLTIPPQTRTLPLIANQSMTAIDVVTIANHNEISGFIIECANVNGIPVNGIGQSNLLLTVSDLSVTNNQIIRGLTGATSHGVELQNVGGNVDISNNNFSFGSSGSDVAINIANVNIHSANYLIQNNLIIASNPISVTNTNCSSLGTTIAGNNINGLMTAVLFNVSDTSVLPASSISIQGNTINCLSNTISLNIAPAMGDFANVDMSVTDNTLTSVASCLYLGLGGNSQTTAVVGNNSMIGGTGIPLIFDLSVNAVNTADIYGNEIKIAVTAATDIHTSNSSTFTGRVRNNIFTGDIAPSLFITSDSPNTMNLEVENNQFIGGIQGIQLNANNATKVVASIVENSFVNSESAGISVTTMGTATAELQVHKNTFLSPMTSAATFTSGGTSLCLSFENNVSKPIVTYPVTGTPLQGVYQFVNGAGTFNLEPLIGNVGRIDYTGVITNVPEGTCQ